MKSKGISYFPMDTEFKMNMKIFVREFGTRGVGVWLLLIMTIQREGGYYLQTNLDDADKLMELAYILNDEDEFVKEVIEYLLKREILSSEMYERYGILTSRRLQKNFQHATKRRKTTSVLQKYNLVDDFDEIDDDFDESVYNSDESVSNNSQKDNIPYQKIIDYLNKKTGGRWRHTTRETQRLIKARFNEGFDIDDFFQAIDNAVEFRTKDGHIQTTYLAPGTLFNGSFEKRANGTAYGWSPEKENEQIDKIKGRY
jgi:uncharacterized phage protein (TIGR02220 family)